MQKDLTDIVVVLDRSGSMSSCRTDAEGGLNTFIEKQKAEPGRAVFTLVQFDNVYEFVHRGIPIDQVPRCVLEPRGGTALLDAIGQAINETGERLRKLPEAERPGLVVFVIITDGGENASTEFSNERIRSMVEHQSQVYNWQFMFLGANQDAFATAAGYGIHTAANYAVHNTRKAFDGASGNLGRMRKMSSESLPIACGFDAEEVEAMK